jgi:hypothetical protein
MKIVYLILAFLVAFAKPIDAQRIKGGSKRLDIPFTLENDFIVIDVRINRLLYLKFIFDTGAEYTIMTKREYADILGIRFEREFRILGSDMTTELVAYLARGINFSMGDIESARQDILVMGDDYYKFEAITGVDVHGIIGANFFNRYIVRIDYERRIISLYEPKYFKPPKKFTPIPVDIYKNKIYFEAESKLLPQDSTLSLKYLLDTGASLSLMLFTDTDESLNLPGNVIRGNIGRGLGGDIEGFIGRFSELNLGPHKLTNLIGNFQEIYPYMDTSERNGRNGLIGNTVLKRFEIIIDYYKAMVYLRPNRSFKSKFKFDRSGIVFVASGDNLDDYVINFVLPGSPAFDADIRKGDIIKRVNWIPAKMLTMKNIYNKFYGKIGKRVKLTLERDGEKIQKIFYLREIL